MNQINLFENLCLWTVLNYFCIGRSACSLLQWNVWAIFSRIYLKEVEIEETSQYTSKRNDGDGGGGGGNETSRQNKRTTRTRSDSVIRFHREKLYWSISLSNFLSNKDKSKYTHFISSVHKTETVLQCFPLQILFLLFPFLNVLKNLLIIHCAVFWTCNL